MKDVNVFSYYIYCYLSVCVGIYACSNQYKHKGKVENKIKFNNINDIGLFGIISF